jgi:hypothetical protein
VRVPEGVKRPLPGRSRKEPGQKAAIWTFAELRSASNRFVLRAGFLVTPLTATLVLSTSKLHSKSSRLDDRISYRPCCRVRSLIRCCSLA